MHDGDLKALRIARDALDAAPTERRDFIARRCGDDAGLRDRVEAMLRGIGECDGIEGPAESPDKDTDTLPGTMLGAYRVAERIGRGGMGVVYRGTREGADFAQTVAIKLIRRGFDFDEVQARFVRERRILARLDHPNLARFVDGGVAPDGRPWFALEFVRGAPITRWCDARTFDLRARVRLFLDVCAAVQYAHAQLVVHRDLKPANILVDGDGHVRLLDFGLAHLLAGEEDAGSTMTLGGSLRVLTPEYAAPEQFAGGDTGVATDVYALGAILYELVAGTFPCPVDRGDPAGAERIVREVPPQSPTQALLRGTSDDAAARLRARAASITTFRATVRGDLTRILDRALAKEPERRYPTVQAFADDLTRWLDGRPVQASGNGFGYRFGKFVRRNRIAVALGTLAALAILVGMATTFWQMREARAQRDAAEAEARHASVVRDYVMLLFRNAAEKRSGNDLTARQMLQSGAEKAVAQLEGKGTDGLATVLALAELYTTMDDLEGASALLGRVLASPLLEQDADIAAQARILAADTEFSRGNLAEARRLLDQAQQWWGRDPQRYRRELNDSRLIQGRIERGESRIEASIETLTSAVADRRALLSHADAKTGMMQVSLSISLARGNRQAEGAEVAEAAYRTYEELGEQNTGYGLGALTNRGAFRLVVGNLEGALADLRLASTTRRSLFGSSAELAKTDMLIAEVLSRQKRYDEAIRSYREVLPMAIEYGGERGRGVAEIRLKLGNAYLAAGDPEAALASAREHLHTHPVKDGDDPQILDGSVHRLCAQALHALGRRDEAMKELDAAERVFRATGDAGMLELDSISVLRKEFLADNAPARSPSSSAAKPAGAAFASRLPTSNPSPSRSSR